MKRIPYYRNIVTVIGIAVALVIFITRPGYSHNQQKDSTKGEKKYRITAKIIEDKDGKKQEFDTTINLNHPIDPREEKEMMKEFEHRFRDIGDQMKDLEEEMHASSLPDSGMMDSVRNYTQHFMKSWKGPGKFHLRHMDPDKFDYDFDFSLPEPPEPPMPPSMKEFDDKDLHKIFDYREINPSRRDRQTLNDVIGDIPMDNVKSYSIRETKDGKRITIELKKDPIIERHENVIILREPGNRGHRDGSPRHEIRKRIIIKSGDKEGKDNPNKL